MKVYEYNGNLVYQSDPKNKKKIQLIYALKINYFKDVPFREEVEQTIPEKWHNQIDHISYGGSHCIIKGLIYEVIVISWKDRDTDSIFAGYFNDGIA
jgi:hypothetical protein